MKENEFGFAGVADGLAGMLHCISKGKKGKKIKPGDIPSILANAIKIAQNEAEIPEICDDWEYPLDRGPEGKIYLPVYGPSNLYPGIPGHGCYNEAFIVSLTCRAYSAGRNHLSFRQALEKLVQHMAACPDKTRRVAIYADSWDADAYYEWQPSINRICQGTEIHIFLMAGGSSTQINI